MRIAAGKRSAMVVGRNHSPQICAEGPISPRKNCVFKAKVIVSKVSTSVLGSPPDAVSSAVSFEPHAVTLRSVQREHPKIWDKSLHDHLLFRRPSDRMAGRIYDRGGKKIPTAEQCFGDHMAMV